MAALGSIADGLLGRVRVLDLTSGISGPYVTKLFADAGADVVKVEQGDGDWMRRWSSTVEPRPVGDDGPYFQFLNTSKRAAALDPDSEGDVAALEALVASATLIVDDRGPDGFDPDWVLERNPGVVLLTLSHWGHGGPFDDVPATEFTLQAWVGSIDYRGVPGEMPFGVGGRLGDYLLAANAAVLALGAVIGASTTGVGTHVDVSQHEAMYTSFTTYQHIFAAFDKPGRRVPRSIEIPSIEPASDGWVGFCTITGQQFLDFTLLIGDPEMGEDPGLVKAEARMVRREDVWPRIHAYTKDHTVDEIVEKATLLRIPVAPIGDGSRVADVDHFAERGVYLQNPSGFTQPRVPYKLAARPPRPFAAAPEAGSTDIGEVGWSRDADVEASSDPAAWPGTVGATPQPLAGIRVVDLSAFWAGPAAVTALGALGADVIKIESIQRPDGMRFASGLNKDPLWEFSPVFHGANPGKRAITLDLSRDEGMALLRRLIAKADLVVENFAPRVLENWGLDWPGVKAINPQAILVRMPAFGLDGPWRDRTGFAMTIEQASGLAFITGSPDGPPLVPRGSCDQLGGMHAAYAAMLALEHRRQTGEGQLVEVALVEAGLNAAAEQVGAWSSAGLLLGRQGNRSPYFVPQGVYPVAGDDQWLAISVERDEQWQTLAALIGLDPTGLDTAAERWDAHDLIDEAITAWTEGRDRQEAVELMLAAGVPAAPVINARVTTDHPQHVGRGFVQWMDHAVAGRVPYPSLPGRFDGAFPAYDRPAPVLGEHNAEVLREELDLTDDEIAALEAAAIIGDHPAFL